MDFPEKPWLWGGKPSSLFCEKGSLRNTTS